MATTPPPARLRLSARSVLVAVALFGLTLALLQIIAASGRVLGWVLTAALIAALLRPVVDAVGRKVHKGAAVALVVLAALGTVGVIGYAVVDDVTEQLRDLQRAVPSAARQLERSERFGDAAVEFELETKAEEFVDELPERLRGGNVEDALRSAATRGLAFLATGVLSIFFLLHGRNLVQAGVRQLPGGRRRGVASKLPAIYDRWWRYVAGNLTLALLAGLVGYGVSVATDLPGRAPLALWLAVFDLVPLIGVVIGALPMVLLALAESPEQAALVAAVLLAWQLYEAFVLQRKVEARSLHVGPFITVGVGMVGLELYGIGGALVGLALVVLALVAVDEWAGETENVDQA